MVIQVMAISVRLDAATERLVARLAKQRGRGKSEVIREAIHTLARAEMGEGTGTSAFDSVSDLVGIARSGRGDLSVRTGEKVRELLRARARR
jgi:hypothetical protein